MKKTILIHVIGEENEVILECHKLFVILDKEGYTRK
jgi:hypothetical protein